MLFLEGAINSSTPIDTVIDLVEERFNLGATFNTVVTEQDIYTVSEPIGDDIAEDMRELYSALGFTTNNDYFNNELFHE